MLKQLSRRGVLGGLCSCGFVSNLVSPANAQYTGGRSAGCMKNGDEYAREVAATAANFSFGSDTNTSKGTSGNRDFDAALSITLGRLVAMFGVNPGFEFYTEEKGVNAYATNRVRYPGRPDGTVAYGRNLLGLQFSNEEAIASAQVVATCAHEFAHILQFKRNVISQLDDNNNVRRSELHADFLAGYFAGRRRLDSPGFPAAEIALDLYNSGDTYTSSPDHHGTPKERGDAVVLGFHAAFTDRVSFEEAWANGLRHFKSIP
jgi:hypothetical protein